MLKRIFKFIGSRIVGPAGTLAQLALLARWMNNSDFNSFLEFYAMAVVVSAVADGGQRNQLFVALRRSHTFKEEEHAVESAARIKVSISVLMLLAAALFWAIGGADGVPTALALLIGVVTPVADVNLTILRSKVQPNIETALVSVEQVLIVALMFAFKEIGFVSLIAAASAMVLAGLIRLYVSRTICKRRYGYATRILPRRGEAGTMLRENIGLVLVALPATISIACTQIFNRYPALTLREYLNPRDYAVFIAFLSLFLRGQLVIFAVLQAGFRSTFRLWRSGIASAPGLIALGAVIAAPVIAIAFLFPETVTRVYVGHKLSGSYIYSAYAAALMLVCYPLCALQQALQLANRNTVVTVGALVGIASQFFLMWTTRPHGSMALAPYAAGVSIYLVICAMELWRKVPRDHL